MRGVVLHMRGVEGAGGGIEKTVLKSGRYLERFGYRSIAAYVHPPLDTEFEVLRQRALRYGTSLVDWTERLPVSPASLIRLARLCRREGVTIWHGHDYKSNVYGLLLKPACGFRLVTTAHGWGVDTPRTRISFALDRRLQRHYERVITVSASLYDECRRLGVEPGRLSLVENGVDAAEFCPTGEARALRTLLRIGAAGRLSGEKGFDVLVDAFAALRGRGRAAELWIAGEGPERGALEMQIRALGVGDAVRLLGHQTEMQEFYRELDVFCLSSLREGLPNVVLEAMAMELPVVATRVGGLPDVVNVAAGGILVEPGSAPALEAALVRLLDSAVLRRRLGQRARAAVQRKHDFAASVAQVAAIYDGLDMARTQ